MSAGVAKKKFDPSESLSPEDRTATVAVMYNIIFLNELAVCQMFNCMNEIEESKYYRHKVKKRIAKVRKLMKDYNSLLNRRTGGRIDFLADLNDKYEEQLDLDVWKLRNACLNVIEKAHLKEKSLIVSLYVSATLICGSCHNVDHCMDGFDHLKYFRKYFRWMRLTEMEQAYIHMVVDVNNMLKVDYQPLLDADLNVQNGFKVLANKLHDADNIIDTCNEHAREWDDVIDEDE